MGCAPIMGRRCAEFAKTGKVPGGKIFKPMLPFNVIPQIDAFQENGYTKEEMKVSGGRGGIVICVCYSEINPLKLIKKSFCELLGKCR